MDFKTWVRRHPYTIILFFVLPGIYVVAILSWVWIIKTGTGCGS